LLESLAQIHVDLNSRFFGVLPGSNRRPRIESDFYTKLKTLDVQEGKDDKIFADHTTQVCEAHNRAILSFLKQGQGLAKQPTMGSRENIGHHVHT